MSSKPAGGEEAIGPEGVNATVEKTKKAPAKAGTGKKWEILEEDYEVQKKAIGEGGFGAVHLARVKASGDTAAVKVIKKATVDDRSELENEIALLKEMGNHDNVVGFFGMYEDKKYMYICMEACTGGEVFDRLAASGNFTERDASRVLMYVLEAIGHCHKYKVAHRDLKPENLMYKSKDPNAPLKVIDFGLAAKVGKSSKLTEPVGTGGYMAKEVIQGSYTTKCDLFAIGAIMFFLLVGELPFDHEDEEELDKLVVKGKYSMSAPEWSAISDEAKDLVKKLLSPEKDRPTAVECLQHPWIVSGGPTNAPHLSTTIYDRWKKHGIKNKVLNAAKIAIANKMTTDEIDTLAKEFDKVDADKGGNIDLQEFKKIIESSGIKVDTDLEEMFRAVDSDSSGTISKKEFVAATMSDHIAITEEKLLHAFEEFDRDKSGKVDLDELTQMLNNDTVLAKDVFKEMDTNKDGFVDLQEFNAYLEKQAVG